MKKNTTKVIKEANQYLVMQCIQAFEPVTLEEIAEIMSRVSLQQLEAPCIFYNLGGYYDSIRQFLEHMKAKGFSTDERQKYIYFARNLAEIQMILEDWNKRRLP